MALDAQTAAAAKAYRDQLNARGIHYGKADAEVDAKFGAGTAAAINPHKVGGFAKVGGGVGDVASKLAPALALVPGVGTLAAAGATAAARGLGKLNDPGGLGGTKVFKEIGIPTATTAALDFGANKLGLDDKVASMLHGGGGAATAGANGVKSTDIIDRVLGVGKSIGKFAIKNPELALGAVNTVVGAKKSAAAGKTQQQATNLAMSDYQDRQKIRDAILAKLMAPEAAGPDLSKVFANRGSAY